MTDRTQSDEIRRHLTQTIDKAAKQKEKEHRDELARKLSGVIGTARQKLFEDLVLDEIAVSRVRIELLTLSLHELSSALIKASGAFPNDEKLKNRNENRGEKRYELKIDDGYHPYHHAANDILLDEIEKELRTTIQSKIDDGYHPYHAANDTLFSYVVTLIYDVQKLEETIENK